MKGGIQFRMLNESRVCGRKGAKGTGRQKCIKNAIFDIVKDCKNLEIIEGSVEDLITTSEQLKG